MGKMAWELGGACCGQECPRAARVAVPRYSRGKATANSEPPRCAPPESAEGIYLVALSKGTSACPPSGSLKRRNRVPDVSAVAHERDKVEVVFGETSTKNTTVR
jgi:hypothetical protein